MALTTPDQDPIISPRITRLQVGLIVTISLSGLAVVGFINYLNVQTTNPITASENSSGIISTPASSSIQLKYVPNVQPPVPQSGKNDTNVLK